MQKFTQKWSIITLLEPASEGYEYLWKDAPQHITLAGVFAADLEKAGLFEKLSVMLANQKPIEATADEEGHWGVNGEYHVVKLQKSSDIMALYRNLRRVLLDAGAIFSEPQFEGEGYIPHSTIQKHARLHAGETVNISELTVVDMFPNGDGYRRKLLRTIKFSE